MKNPLLDQLHDILQAHPQGLAEYDLLRLLKDHPSIVALKNRGNLALFQKHFLIMNGLYQLQMQLWEKRATVLRVDPLKIVIEQNEPDIDNTQLGVCENPALRDYYLDWNNFNAASEADVDELLTQFWNKYENYLKRDEALAILDLEPNASQQKITQRYRELAARYHPDKGGDTEQFIKIRQAYEKLQSV